MYSNRVPRVRIPPSPPFKGGMNPVAADFKNFFMVLLFLSGEVSERPKELAC